MSPDDLSAELRPRNTWESIDFGFAAARRWWWPVARAWALAWLPLYALAWGLLHPWPLAAVGLLWALKPAAGRLPLWVLGSALFGSVPSARRVLREAPRLLGLDPWSLLGPRRLDPQRALTAPILVLEGGAPRDRARRRAALRGGADPGSAWLALSCLALKWGLFMGIVGSFFAMVPDRPDLSRQEAWATLVAGAPPPWLIALLLAADLLATCVVEPLFIAGGFGLYINRRSQLEGWDISIAFQRLARRLAAPGLALLLLLPGLARGQEADTAEPQPPDIREVVARVLEDEEFGAGGVTTRRVLREDVMESLRGACDRPERERERPTLTTSSCVEAPSRAVEGGLLAILGVGLVMLLVAVLRRWDLRDAPGFASGPPPVAQGGSALPDAPLPPDLAELAWRAWTRGEHVRALGMLYHGALRALARRGLPVTDGMTEDEARRMVRRRAEAPVADVFERTTRAWQLAAYAHRLPADEHVRQLCAAWPAAFGDRP